MTKTSRKRTLKQLVGRGRFKFTGNFVRVGRVPMGLHDEGQADPERYVDPTTGIVTTVVLSHVTGPYRGHISHLWFTVPLMYRDIITKFKPGERITFDAWVSSYFSRTGGVKYGVVNARLLTHRPPVQAAEATVE